MKIIHVMKDGTVRDSIEGVVIPASNKEAYKILERQVADNEKVVKAENIDCA